MTKKSVITKLLTALMIGAIAGVITGGLILGGLGWFSDGSGASGDQSRWAFLGLYLGARLGLLLGSTLGALAGLLWILFSYLRQTSAVR